MKISYCQMGIPAPYERMNSLNRWAPRVQNYLAYKATIAAGLRLMFPQHVLDIPPVELKKERAAFLKAHKDIIYRLDWWVYLDRERGDNCNYLKPIEDALQDAGLIVNDKRIREHHGYLYIGQGEPRLSFTLQTLDEMQEKTA